MTENHSKCREGLTQHLLLLSFLHACVLKLTRQGSGSGLTQAGVGGRLPRALKTALDPSRPAAVTLTHSHQGSEPPMLTLGRLPSPGTVARKGWMAAEVQTLIKPHQWSQDFKCVQDGNGLRYEPFQTLRTTTTDIRMGTLHAWNYDRHGMSSSHLWEVSNTIPISQTRKQRISEPKKRASVSLPGLCN